MAIFHNLGVRFIPRYGTQNTQCIPAVKILLDGLQVRTSFETMMIGR